MAHMNMVQALNSAMDIMLERDPRVVVLGEDVGYFGGVFRVTDGLQRKHGEHRVIDTPIAEGGIVAAAIGMGVNGLKPVAEIQFADYIYPAFDQVVSELARLFDCNAVIAAGADNPALLASAPRETDLAPSDLAAASMTLASGEPTGRGVARANLADWTFYPIASGETVLAAAGLARNDGAPPVAAHQNALLGNLLDQVALAIERERFERDARENMALRERDRLRSALLSSIGDDVKPRLAAIAAAARALKRGGTADKAQASAIADEAARLDRYVENLIDLRPGDEQEPIAVGPLSIDLHRRSVSRDGAEVHLTPKEFALLNLLAQNAGRVLPRHVIIERVWGADYFGDTKTLDVHIKRLRARVEDDPAEPTLIQTVRGVGYTFEA